ncbi:MAG: cupin domain-containing protein [Syntrophomonadaceae bacterium]|nr:cupin domain-containing protein [Syntrophomonadaceae bacterium]
MNLFSLPGAAAEGEVVQALIPDRGVRIERIVSRGQASPPGYWYDQERDEWVAVLQGTARLRWADGREVELQAGDWILIPAHARHRVEYTSSQPPCIWLAVHGPLC